MNLSAKHETCRRSASALWMLAISALAALGVLSPATCAALPKPWAAKEDFSGPKDIPQPLDAWERFAQVLLLSKELMFVD